MADEIQIPESQPPLPPKGRGCFFYGCLTCLVLLLVVALSVFLVVRYVKGQIDAYTDTAPAKLPKVEMSDAEFTQLRSRVRSFSNALQEGKPTGPLVLSERDINAWLVKSQAHNELADNLHVSLSGDQVKGQLSLPLTGLPLAKGRYLNAEATFKVYLTNGVLGVVAQEIKVKGNPLPDRLQAPVKNFLQELTKQAYNDPRSSDATSQFDSIVIQNNRVTITPRTNAVTAPAP